MAFMRNLNDFILTLVALSLPSIAATIDCNGKPFHCLNSTHFMICVDFGSGVSSTMDDFVIPCPPTTVCQATNRFECEFPTVTTTTVTPIVTNSPLAATVNNDVVIDTVSAVTTIPFEEYFNSISTTTLSESNFTTRDTVTTDLPVNNPAESEVNVAATYSNINETTITVGISPNYFTTLATLDIVTDAATVTELIPNVAENVNVIFEPNSYIGGALPNATEIIPTYIDHTNFSENNTVDVTENYESNSTLLETIIGATNFRLFNTTLHNLTYNVTEPILSEPTESIISIPFDNKQVDLTTLDASPDVVFDNIIIENVTESIPMKTTEYMDLIQFQSNSTLNETMPTGGIVQNEPTTLNTALDTNGFTLNVNNSDLSFNEMTTKYEEQISTPVPILLETKENTTSIPVDVFLHNQTRKNATESILAETTEYKHLIQSQSNRFNNKTLYNSAFNDVTESILSEATESIISIPFDDKQVNLTTLDASPDVVFDNIIIEDVTESIPTKTTEYNDLIQFQGNSTLNETMPTGGIVKNDPTTLNTALDTNGFTLNVNNSDLSFNEMTTKYEEQISTPVPILFEAKETITSIPVDVFLNNQTRNNATESIPAETTEYKHLIQSQSNRFNNKPLYNLAFNDVTESILSEATESIISKPIDDKQVYLTTRDASPNVVLDDKTIENVTESIPTNTTEYKDLIQFQSNTTLNETISTGDVVQNDPTRLTTALDTNGSAFNVNNSDLSFNKITTKYEEQISIAEPVLNEAKENELDDKKAYWTTLDTSPDVFLDDKIINTVTESIPVQTTEYSNSIDPQRNSIFNASMSSGDIEQSNTITDNTVLNTNGSTSNVHNSNLSLNEDTTPYYEEQISIAKKFFELSGSSGTEITQPETEMLNITKSKLNVSTIATTTVNTESVSTITSYAAINTDTAGEVTVTLNVIESGNKTNIYDDMQTTELSFKVRNHYLITTEDSVTSISDNTYVKSDNNNKNTTQSENLTNLYLAENVTKTETESEEIHLVLEKPPSSNETTTIVHGNRSSADNSSTSHTIPNIHTIIAQNKTTFHDNSARTDQAQRVLRLEVNVNDKTADATKLQPVTEPTSTSLSNIAYNVIGSDLTNENPQEMSTFINRIELTTRDNVTNETLTQNIIGIDMNNSTVTTVTPSNQFGLNNRVSVLTADDKINAVEISESTPNDILETATQEVDSFTYSNVYYQTDIEEISHDQGVPRNNILSADTIESIASILVLTTESTKEPHFDTALQATSSFNSVSDKTYAKESDNYLTSTTNSLGPEATPTSPFDIINSAVNTSKPVIRGNEVEEISTSSATLEVTSTINETAYVATKQNIPSAEVTPEPADLILDRLKYTTTTETVNDSVHQGSRLTMASDFSTTIPFEKSVLSALSDREIKETLIATTTSNTATNLSAIPNLTVSYLSGAGDTNLGVKINGITVVDSLTTKTTVDAISEASTDNVMEKYPITIKIENINPENTRNSIKTNTTTEEITITEDRKPLRSYSLQRENISKLEITSVVTDKTTLGSFISDDVNYTEDQNLASIQDRLLSNAQVKPNISEILPKRFGVNIYEPNSSVKKATFIDGITLINIDVAADTKLTRDNINQQSTNKLVTPKTSKAETLFNEILKGKDVLPVMPELKTNSESTVKIKTSESNGDINANPIITTKTSTIEPQTERVLSLTTSIQESKYQSNLASSTEAWRATAVTEPVVHPTRPYTETLITSSKPYTESNDQMSQDVTSLMPNVNLANPSENQYINLPQNIEPATKNIMTSSEPSGIFPPVTEPSGIANQDAQQKSYGIDTLMPVQNQRVLSTENHFINVTPLASFSTITKPVNLSTRQSFTAPNKQILPEQHVFTNGEQIEVPTTEQLKFYVIPNISSSSVKDNKPLPHVTAVPILKSIKNISKDVMPNAKSHLITVPKTEFDKFQLNITSTTEKTMTQSSDLGIIMVDVIKTNSPNLREIAIFSNNTHSGISALQKSTSKQDEKRKTIKSEVANDLKTEKEEKHEVAETNPSSNKIKHLTSTEGLPIKKQDNVEHNPPINTKQRPLQDVTTRISPVDAHVKNTTARYNTKTKSPVANTHTHNSTLPASEISKHNFACKSNNRGRFSDNGDCRKFYICIGKHEPIEGICPNNTVFSELRKQCTKNLSHCVRNNQFQCVSEGRFSDYLYDNIYYICVSNRANKFIRFKLQCQNGYYLNKTSVRCVLNTESKSASEVSISNQSASAKSEKIKEKPKSNKKFECKRSGKFPEPNDCRKYYVCTKLGKSEYRQRIKKCDRDEVYNRDKKKCVDADSYECS